MENNNNIIITMEYADGTNGKRELLSIFKAENGRDYAALLPLNEDETIQDNANIELVRVKKYENDEVEEDYLIEGINSEEELKTAAEAFKQLEIVSADGENNIDLQENVFDDLQTISFKNGNGQFEDWKIIDVFEHKNLKYIALVPMEETENEAININLMRLTLTVQGGVEGCEVTTIPSDMEYEDVANVFEKRISTND